MKYKFKVIDHHPDGSVFTTFDEKDKVFVSNLHSLLGFKITNSGTYFWCVNNTNMYAHPDVLKVLEQLNEE